ncbi:MAG: hypothetical protein ACOC83_10020 [Gemmatimonadota bacterium]
MEAHRPGLSARAMAAVMTWIESWPLPLELFGDLARWLPGTIFVVGVAVTLLLLYGVPFDAEAGRWLVGAAAVPVWILRVATLERDALRAHRLGPALSMLAWWMGGVAIVASVWAANGRLGAVLTLAVTVLFLFLAHGRYALVVDDRRPSDTGGAS